MKSNWFRSWNLFVKVNPNCEYVSWRFMESIKNRAGTPVLVTGTSSSTDEWWEPVPSAQSTLSRRPASSNIFRSAANCTWDTAQLSNPLGLHLNHDHNRKMVVAERDLPQTINLGIYNDIHVKYHQNSSNHICTKSLQIPEDPQGCVGFAWLVPAKPAAALADMQQSRA